MPNAGLQKWKVGTPRFSGLALLECLGAMYQSGFIGSGTKAQATLLIRNGMNTGDYTELNGYIAEQCRREQSGNPFWDQMKEILSEEGKE